MSDGISDANREAKKVVEVESAAFDLAEALLATGDPMFFKVHPQAAEYANAVLHDLGAGYKLVKVDGNPEVVEKELSKKGLMSVCVDFDGVLHSYKSGWKGADVIPDPPVEGAMPWLIELSSDGRFEACIYSSRSKEPGGIEAMREWLRHHFKQFFLAAGVGRYDANGWADRHLRRLRFPTQKPAATMTIDDRAFCFEGSFPTLEWIAGFRPWNKR